MAASGIDDVLLDRKLASLRTSFDAALPFRHVVIDDFLCEGVAQEVRAEFPDLTAAQRRAARVLAARMYKVDQEHFGTGLRDIFADLSGTRFTQWLRAFTGVADLVMDPHNVGGGVHRGARGSHLYVHADHNTHPSDPTRYRRFNVLIYLTPDWDPRWGGELELWDAACSHVVRRIEPRFNRCVIMEVHDRAFHGYRRLHFPPHKTRDSLAAYYYSDVPATLQEPDAHATVFGVERDAGVVSRTAAAVRRALLKRMFPTFVGLPPQRDGASLGVSSDVGQGLVEAGQHRVPMDLQQ